MSAATIKRTPTAIWLRIIEKGARSMTPEAARWFLNWKFSARDLHRVDRLSAKARSGTLTSAEEAELDDYLGIECVLGVLHSKARIALKKIRTET